jgi:hypothetical protein
MKNVKTNEAGPFVLVSADDDWYVIPKAREQDFAKWAELPSDNHDSWTPPQYAERVGGAPSLVEFPTYVVR